MLVAKLVNAALIPMSLFADTSIKPKPHAFAKS